MALTQNQIVSRLRRLALSHFQINSFYFGDVPEFDANGEVDYPACFCEQLPGSIDRTEHQQRFNFRFYFVDLVGVSEETEVNETDVLSDMHSVSADYLAMCMYSEYEADWMISPSASISAITESLGDMVAGCYLDIGILVDFIADRCQVPSSSVTFETDNDMARTKIITYTGTGSEGESFTPTGLSGCSVLAVYRAGTYKRAITSIPTDYDTIGVEGTDLGSKGILSTGVVNLSVGDLLIDGEILDFLIYA